MSCSLGGAAAPRRRARRRLPPRSAWTWAAAALAIGCGACGKKEPPLPPPNPAPATVGDLAVEQRGDELILRFTYPATTAAGLALAGIETVEVWRMGRLVEAPPAPPPLGESPDEDASPATPPPPRLDPELAGALARMLFTGRLGLVVPAPVEEVPAVAPQEFAAAAELALTVEGEALHQAIAGDQIILPLPLPAPLPAPRELVAVAVKTIAAGGRESALSVPKVVVPVPPPAPPPAVTVTPQEAGIQLSWESAPEAAGGYRVYRRDAGSRRYGGPVATLPRGATTWRDSGAAFGARYVYAVTAVAEVAPLVESRIASEHEVDHRDVYPPPAPQRLVALAEEGGVRLLWGASAAADLAGYRVERREGGGGWAPLNAEPLADPELVDRGAVPGRTYRYRVLALDAAGNAGPPSNEVEATAR